MCLIQWTFHDELGKPLKCNNSHASKWLWRGWRGGYLMSLHFVIFFNFEAALKEGLQKRLKFSKFLEPPSLKLKKTPIFLLNKAGQF